MTNRLDWNRERYRTRDRLLEYDFNIYPAVTHTAGLSMIYPWENMELSVLQKQIYQIALNNGYQEGEDSFWKKFSRDCIVFGTIDTFPVRGDEKTLYLDTESETLYYFKKTTTFNAEVAAILDVAIVDKAIVDSDGTEEFYLYVPIRAALMENILLNLDGGSATDVIDS